MLRAIIFDCDGVIVDSEPHHFKAFHQILSEEGIPFTKEAYFQKYLALDDKTCFETALAAHGRAYVNRILKNLIIRKLTVIREIFHQERVHSTRVVNLTQKQAEPYQPLITLPDYS